MNLGLIKLKQIEQGLSIRRYIHLLNNHYDKVQELKEKTEEIKLEANKVLNQFNFETINNIDNSEEM